MMKQEQTLFKAREQFENLIRHLQNTPSEETSLHGIEKHIWTVLLSIGKLLLQFFIETLGTGDVGETVVHQGRTFRRLKTLHSRRYVSVFGDYQIQRTVYGTRENQKHEIVPLDARLNLPDNDFSYLLQDWAQAFCVQGAYGEAAQTLQRILGASPSVRSLEHMARQMAPEVEAYRQTESSPPHHEEGAFVVLTGDGKGVVMRPESGQGEKASAKKQACVGAVYTIDPFPRTAEDIVNETFRREVQEQRPRPCHKRVRAQLTWEKDGVEVKGKVLIFDWLKQECQSRNPEQTKATVCLLDGEQALWTQYRTLGDRVIGILDLDHVMERLWTAAHCFYKEGSPEARSFAEDRLRQILQGKVGRVIGGLRQMATKRGLKRSQKKQLQAVITYWKNHREWMQYDYYLAMGYLIGSGVVEGTCRHLVKDRMEQSGMRWKTEGAQSILDLRATYINDEWEEFQEHRVKNNLHQLYPYRDTIDQLWRNAA